jgi:hypothetical protein
VTAAAACVLLLPLPPLALELIVVDTDLHLDG